MDSRRSGFVLVGMSEDEDERLLEAPPDVDGLYYARLDEVPDERPVLTGDIFSSIEIPGLGDGGSLAVVLTHPCAMRKDGVHLVDRIFMARVRNYQSVPLEKWATQHFKVMPLPELVHGGTDAAFFNEAGLVASEHLHISCRVACLSESGINLLQQRFVYHLTRFAVPTTKLHRVAAHVFREAELQEEWVAERKSDVAIADSAMAFHQWIRASSGGGPSRQDRLTDPQQVAAVRREMRLEMRA